MGEIGEIGETGEMGEEEELWIFVIGLFCSTALHCTARTAITDDERYKGRSEWRGRVMVVGFFFFFFFCTDACLLARPRERERERESVCV